MSQDGKPGPSGINNGTRDEDDFVTSSQAQATGIESDAGLPGLASGRTKGRGATGLPKHTREGEEGNMGPSSAANISSGQPILSGWARIEEWMTTLDKGMVGDFHEDINTLLTFAGLFSAVVTAFLLQLYLELQPGSNQTTNNLLTQTTSLLGQISQQLANSSIIPVDIPTPSPPFQASGSTIWISTLWFLSLILSLAAALFGMISKQWLREYLQWTTMSGPSEHQVALRQARYEAFMDWKTPAIIALMPVLLEIALIVFLLGLEGLLWTLNVVVFRVCTVAIVTLIMMVILVTVLPVFRARCPYKSPVGWAALLVKLALFSLWSRSLDLVEAVARRLCFRSLRASGLLDRRSVVVEKDWRGWDLMRQTWRMSGKERAESAAALGRRQMLSRALWWIRENSQDQRLMDAAIEGLTCEVNPSISTFDALAADIYFVCERLTINPTDIIPPEDECADIVAGDSVIRFHLQVPDVLSWSSLGPHGQWRNCSSPLRVDAPRSVLVAIVHLLTSGLLAVVSRYNEDDVQELGRRADYFLQVAYSLTAFLIYHIMLEDTGPSVTADCLVELPNVLCRTYATNPTRLKLLLPLILRSFDEYKSQAPALRMSSAIKNTSRIRLGLNTPPGQPSDWSRVDCSVFNYVFQSALSDWQTSDDTAITLLPQLFDRMSACVHRCSTKGWTNCAVAPHEFRWPELLSKLFNNDLYSGRHLPANMLPHDLINTLREHIRFVSSSNNRDRIVELSKLSIARKDMDLMYSRVS